MGNHYIVEMELPERQCVVGTLVPRVFIYGIVQDGISGDAERIRLEEVVVFGQCEISLVPHECC